MTRLPVGREDVLDEAIDRLRAGKRVVIATVLRTWGSSPRPVGSQLAIDDGASFVGSVSGGCVEAATVRAALDVMAGGAPRRIEFGVTDGEARGVGLACGGRIEILLDPFGGELALLEELRRERDARRSAVLATEIATGRHVLVGPGGVSDSRAGLFLVEPARRAMELDRSEVLARDDGDWFLLVRNPAPRMFIVGAVHVAQALAPTAALNGFDVVVIDPREAFASEERFPGVTIRAEWPDAVFRELDLDSRSAVVALSHDAKIDDAALRSALGSGSFYVGALGSRRTHAARLARLEDAGVARSELARIRGPVGLDIGARTAAEIATSIMAEVIQTLRGGGSKHRPSRASSTSTAATPPRVAALILAAGQSSRMGAVNKLVAPLAGKALVRHAVDAALGSRAAAVVVVTGYRSEEVRAALHDCPVVFARNPEAESGLSSTLRTGLAALGTGFDGAVVCLGDMPRVRADHIDALIDAFEQSDGRQACVPVHHGRRGNPVLWPRSHFDALERLTGDAGGRVLLDSATGVRAVAVADDGILIDVDTLEDLRAL